MTKVETKLAEYKRELKKIEAQMEKDMSQLKPLADRYNDMLNKKNILLVKIEAMEEAK